MPNIINHHAEEIAYVELTHNRKCRVELCFAWIDNRMFLPASLLNDDPAEAGSQVLKADNDIFSLGTLNYFVPFQWLKEQRPDLADLLENIRVAAEPYRRKFPFEPCSVCRRGQTAENDAE